jgi:RimJ/RimL family protein N-acetyltransferase
MSRFVHIWRWVDRKKHMKKHEKKMSNTYFWQGRKIRLRPGNAADWEKFYEDCFDSEGRRLLQCGIELPKSKEMAKAGAEKWADFTNSTERIMFSIETLKGESVGGINLCSMDHKNGTFSFGIRVFRRHQGRGYGTEALRMILRYAFHELRFQKCNSDCLANNEGSMHLHEGIGFKREGLRRRVTYTNGQYYDHVLYGLTREEFDDTDTARRTRSP